jgi:hypothetical protein
VFATANRARSCRSASGCIGRALPGGQRRTRAFLPGSGPMAPVPGSLLVVSIATKGSRSLRESKPPAI